MNCRRCLLALMLLLLQLIMLSAQDPSDAEPLIEELNHHATTKADESNPPLPESTSSDSPFREPTSPELPLSEPDPSIPPPPELVPSDPPLPGPWSFDPSLPEPARSDPSLSALTPSELPNEPASAPPVGPNPTPDPTIPEPPPTPEPTPDPNVPPGMEDMELLAFRLEYAEEYVLVGLMEWAYDWVARDRGHEDGVLRARDLPDFLHRTLNPAEEDIEDEERAMLQDASEALREEQGLHRDDMHVHIGFLSRGSPVRYVRRLAYDMHHQNQARRRRLQEVILEDRDL